MNESYQSGLSSFAIPTEQNCLHWLIHIEYLQHESGYILRHTLFVMWSISW